MAVKGEREPKVLEKLEEEEEEEEVEEEEEEEEEEELGSFNLSEETRDLEEKLSQIQVHIPEVVYAFDWSSIDTCNLPETYRTNSPKEQLLLQVADNFCRQYTHLCPDREPLFLHPINECKTEKFVSTTVRPTLLPYSELYDWDKCSHFVSNYLTMEPLPSPIAPPSYLYSPTTILRYQRGNCFDFSNLLCSLLIGAGYDAYCVNGYATREMCTMDETKEICPLLKKVEEATVESIQEKPKKYAVKPLRDLRSKFETRQSAKEAEKEHATEEKKRKEEYERIAEAEKSKPDPLYGLRVHAWVLILSGKREVPESFFIDPFTGISYDTRDDHFLGIESVWNHRNYWVNMQDCWNGCKDLQFDLGDPVRWEFMLLGTDKPLLSLPEVEEDEEGEDELEDLIKEEDSWAFDMPASWVEPIRITQKDFETRYPQGKKEILYKNAKLERWAPYLKSNGMVSRLALYADPDYSKLLEVKEWFNNRADMMERRELNKQTEVITEYYIPGHNQGLKVHSYKTMEPETERTMEFYSETRVDGLQKRVETPKDMVEYFEGRSDFLRYRHTEFGKRIRKVVSSSHVNTESNARPILKITERFHRNPEKPADEDVAERIFLIQKEKILLTYHYKKNYITASKREFNKRSEGETAGNKIIMTQDTCISYQAGVTEKEEKLFPLYEMLLRLIEEEKLSKHQVWESEMEVLEILRIRGEEIAANKLTVSIYNTDRNEKSREQRELMERLMQEEHQRQMEQDLDYLAPFLIQIEESDKMTTVKAHQLKEACMADLKHRLIEKANLIQALFEKETQELQKKQQWYQQNQLNMSLDDEDSYLSFCSEAMFRIRILENRLNRHRERAPQRFATLDEKLSKDPRLVDFLKHI